jgi:benzil reductase ((S)-benzoin forming)
MEEVRGSAVVTGTSSGIGEAVARELLARGWSVVGIARRDAPLHHPAYTHLRVDLSDVHGLPDRVEAAIGTMASSPAVARVGLVNNAADPGLLGPVTRIDPAGMLGALAVNVAAPTWLMGWAVRRAGSGVPLRIVNVLSGAGVRPLAGLATYGGSKAALRLIGMVLGVELDAGLPDRHRDVTILSYSPGPVDTPMQAGARDADPEVFPLRPMFRRWATDGELMSADTPAAEIVAYLESDGHPRFLECRSGELPVPGRSG